MLKQRILTAIILGAAMAWVVFKLPNYLAALIFGLITLLGAWEWVTLLSARQLAWRLLYTVFVGGLLFATWHFSQPYHVQLILLVASLWWAAVVIMLAMYDASWLQTNWLRQVLLYSSFITLVPAWLALTTLHKQDPAMLMFLLVLVWAADIAAYFIGKRFGKNKLAPGLSPGKSREGVLGALVAAFALAILGMYLFAIDKSLWFYFGCLCLIIALISVVGDLYESLLKRQAGAKDSGKILPGHGGMLDRIDSLTAAAPGFVFGIYWTL